MELTNKKLTFIDNILNIPLDLINRQFCIKVALDNYEWIILVNNENFKLYNCGEMVAHKEKITNNIIISDNFKDDWESIIIQEKIKRIKEFRTV